MHRIIIALVMAGAGLLLGVALVAADGGPHGGYTTTTEACGSCHRAHTGQADKLLRIEAGQLCLFCHDGTGASNDTWDGARLGGRLASRTTDGLPIPPAPPSPTPATGITGALKGGGFVYARIDSGNLATPGAALPNVNDLGTPVAGKQVTSAHVKFGTTAGVDGNALTPQNVIWGNGAISATANPGKTIASSPLSCIDCHNPHGNGSYRILRPIPKQSDAASPGTLLADVPVVNGTPGTKVYTTTNYWTQYAVGTAKDAPWTPTDVSNWCSTCHTRYKASSSDNSGDAIFKYRHQSDGSTAMGGQDGAPYTTTFFATQCLQCHVAHGSNAVMRSDRSLARIEWPGGTTGRGVESTLLKIDGRGVCVACHGTTPGS